MFLCLSSETLAQAVDNVYKVKDFMCRAKRND